MKNPENRAIFDQRMIDIQFLLNAIKVSMVQGRNFLINRLMPKGPIMRERHLNYIYKAIWGMFAADVDKTLLFRMLDWVWEKALHANGDFFFFR